MFDENSKFSKLVNDCCYIDDLDTIKNLYSIQEGITENLEIIFTPDYENLESIVRILTDIDLKYGKNEGKFIVINCPEELETYVRWFISLFALLQSYESNFTDYPVNTFHRFVFSSSFMTIDLDIEDMMFGYDSITVIFLTKYPN